MAYRALYSLYPGLPAIGGTTSLQRPVGNVALLVLSLNVEEAYVINSKSLIVDYLPEYVAKWVALAKVSFALRRAKTFRAL